MKFGISLIMRGKHATADAFVTLAQRVEALGYDAVWVSDHIFFPKLQEAAHPDTPHGGLPPAWTEGYWESLSVLGHVAAHTQRITVGTSVLILPMHHPIQVAKRIAMLDHFSKGRFVFGVGVGWLREEFEALNWPFRERGARTDEGLEICKKLWTEHKPSHAGRFYRFEEAWFDPKPLQKPHPPIWVAGHTPAALKRTARFGDCWHPFRPTHALLDEKLPELKRLLEERGRKLSDVRIAPKMTVTFQDTPPQQGQDPTEGRAQDILDTVRRFRDQGATDFVIDIKPETLPHALEVLERFATEVRAKL
jgi:probable F420-dependent oxidoreductase